MAAVTKQDFLLAVRKASFAVPGAYSLRGHSGETRLGGIVDAKVERGFIDSTMVRTEITGTLGGTSLKVLATAVDFRDYPATILSITLENPTDAPVTIDRLSLIRREFCGEAPVLVCQDGTECEIPMPPPPPKERPAQDKRQHLPHFDDKRYLLSFEECTVMIDCASPKMFHLEPLGVMVMIGTRDLTVEPGQSIVFSPITLFVSEGDVERATELISAWENAHF